MRLVVVCSAILLSSTSAHAIELTHDEAICYLPHDGAPDKEVVVACTKLLDSGRYSDIPREIDGIHSSSERSYIRSMRGLAYDGVGDHADALADFIKNVADDPKDFTDLINEGQVLEEMGRNEEAISAYSQALALPRNPVDGRWLYFPFRAKLYDKMRLYDKAMSDYRETISEMPYNADYDYGPNFPLGEAYNGLAWDLHTLSRDTEALSFADTAIMASHGSANMYETRAEIREKLGQREAAITDYQAAFKINPKEPGVLEGLTRLGAQP